MHLILLLLATNAFAKPNIGTGNLSKALNDAWYTIQADNTPWGYYHEIIEERADKYSYRYNMTKVEKGEVYLENIGALAQKDLTPIAFNLNKSTRGATETTNATYEKSGNTGQMVIETGGARRSSIKRMLSKNIILDVFFPVWLVQNWGKLKPGFKGWVQTFAEDPERQEFRSRIVHFEAKGMDTDRECMKIHVEMDANRSDWCMTSSAALVELKMSGVLVERVSGEKEAKAFLSGVMPKPVKKE